MKCARTSLQASDFNCLTLRYAMLKDCCCDQEKRNSGPQKTSTTAGDPTGNLRELQWTP